MPPYRPFLLPPTFTLVTPMLNQALRLVVNREPVGADLGFDYSGGAGSRDLFAQGDCDAAFLRLAELLGWRADLEALLPDLPPLSQALLQPPPSKV